MRSSSETGGKICVLSSHTCVWSTRQVVFVNALLSQTFLKHMAFVCEYECVCVCVCVCMCVFVEGGVYK